MYNSDYMNQKELFLKFWKHEGAATRRVISRIPEDKSDYTPHPTSRTARALAWLMVVEERILADGLEAGVIDWSEGDTPATMSEIIETYDAQHDDITARLEALDEATWEKEFGFTVEGTEYRRASGYEYGWEFLFDQIHHRGQLSTYLRPMGAKVPAIIGPSADEMM